MLFWASFQLHIYNKRTQLVCTWCVNIRGNTSSIDTYSSYSETLSHFDVLRP